MNDPKPSSPNPFQWVWYAFGGGLPEQLRPWVLYDLTCPTWVLRHTARAVTQLSVFVAAVLLLLPGAFWIRGIAALGGFLMGLFYSYGYMHETAEHRAVKAGYPVGTVTAAHNEVARTRSERANAANRDRRVAAANRTKRRAERRNGR